MSHQVRFFPKSRILIFSKNSFERDSLVRIRDHAAQALERMDDMAVVVGGGATVDEHSSAEVPRGITTRVRRLITRGRAGKKFSGFFVYLISLASSNEPRSMAIDDVNVGESPLDIDGEFSALNNKNNDSF